MEVTALIAIGLRVAFDFVEEAAQLSYDYLELPLNWTASLSDAQFEELAAYVSGAKLRIAAMYDMLPPGLRVNGRDVRAAEQHAYLKRAFARAARLGAGLVAFDAAEQRNVPAGADFDLARRQTGNFMRIVQGHAAQSGLTVAIRNLRRARCNMINTVSEAALMAALLQLGNVGVLADTVQMAYQSEALSVLETCPAALKHVYTGCALKRCLPYPGDGEDYVSLFRLLTRRGYAGGVTAVAEGEYSPAAAASALKLLRVAREEALV